MSGFHCPNCGSQQSRVSKTQRLSSSKVIVRTRYCKKCNEKYQTREYLVLELPLVHKLNKNKTEEFNKEKLIKSIKLACAKFSISDIQIENIATRIEEELKQYNSQVVDSNVIGEMVMEELKELHPIIYLRFASVYKDLDEVDEFLEFAKNVAQKWKENNM